MPPGKVRAALGLEGGWSRKSREDDTGSLPHGTVGLRVGIAPRTEVRGKLALLGGGEVGVNVLAVDGERVDLMLMPGYFDYDVDEVFDEYSDDVRMRGFALPAVVGVELDRAGNHQVFVAPDVRVGTRDRAAWGAAGLHLGFALFAGDAGHGTLVPECAWLVGFGARGQDGTGVEPPLQHGGHNFSCSLGVTFGSSHASR